MTGHDDAQNPGPVTPSEGTERPAGLAFDVEKGADLPGVPVGDQTPHNPGAARIDEVVDETGGVPPGGAAVPDEHAAT